MANRRHVGILKRGVKVWNAWRRDNPGVVPNLRDGKFRGINLTRANLAGADLTAARLVGAHLARADLTRASLSDAWLHDANLSGANLAGADLNAAWLHLANLTGANLTGAQLAAAMLWSANFAGADLTGAALEGAQCVGTDLRGAKLVGSQVYGISAWDLVVDEGTQQHELIITPHDQPSITVDNLEVAQFIYLLLNNKNVRRVIDTITSKVVLILGRFTPERKAVLDALREGLRKRDRLPVIFDFDKPATQDTHETITTLARMARFIIADITDPKSIPQELVSIVEQLPSVAVQPILQEGSEPWGMFDHIKRYPWVLPVVRYTTKAALVARIDALVISPAETKVREIRGELSGERQ